ncbi:MAG: hypothetical protein N0A24_09940 [Armatimonadetes bacterium]|nr:hypothetical protein [Armatimonadota bacterium]MDW8154498.1 hypothetical protein [Armatimonadota bacterium]
MRRGVVFLILFCLGLGVPLWSQPVPTAIVPGEAIGPIRIGMSMDAAAQLVQSLGASRDENNEDGRRVCNTEAKVGFCIFDYYQYGEETEAVKTPGQVLAVATDDPRFKFSNGAGVGSPLMDLLRMVDANPEFLFTGPGEVLFEWPSRGLLVGVRQGQNGAEVSFILVFRPRR